MKTYAWSFGCAMVFLIAGVLAATGAVLNVSHVICSTEGMRSIPFVTPLCRGLAGGAGLLLAVAGLASFAATWRAYRWERAQANSPWKRFCRADT